MQKLLSTSDVAEVLSISVDTIRDYIREGRLSASYIGRRWKVREEDLHQFLRDNRRSK